MKKDLILEDLHLASKILNNFLENDSKILKIEEASDILSEAINNGNKIISCGNGGSMSDAMHFSEELMGRYRNDRNPLPSLAISDPSYLSCVSNDFGYDMVFSRYVQSMGNTDDVLLAITTSGESENILKAIEKAKIKNMKIVALTGKKGLPESISDYVDVEIKIQHEGFSDRIQEMHIKILHIFVNLIEQNIQ